jgi:hypothetical protein
LSASRNPAARRWPELAELAGTARAEAAAFSAEHRETLEWYRAEIQTGIREALSTLGRDVDQLSGGNPLCRQLLDQTVEYIDWMQWTLWDLPTFAVAFGTDLTRFRKRVAACGFVYLSFRVIDDMLDRHYLYRGRRPTLLKTFTSSHGQGHDSEGLTVLASLLLSFDGMARLVSEVDAGDEVAAAGMRRLVASARQVLVGAILERSDESDWSLAFYERLVARKNVDYWRMLNAALDPDETSPLHPFLIDYYGLAQRLNDIQDHSADEARGQPNLVTITRRQLAVESCSRGFDEPAPTAMQAVEEVVRRDFMRLGERFAVLRGRERGAASVKFMESLSEARRLGLFADLDSRAPVATATLPKLDLVWDSTAEEFLERLGPDALEDVACSVCGGDDLHLLFRKRGFALRRCRVCTHIFVTPRTRAEVLARLSDELDGHGEDPYLDIQRIHAEHLCQVLRRVARGPRFLDVGFGHGYLLHLAQAYGFEAYGVESSLERVHRLGPVFGRRLARASIGRDRLPWGSFDVIAMSHVLEHLSEPRAALKEAREALADDGLLYIAVPDMDSAQFRVFGKRWDVISPVAHLQYFTSASLTRLLGTCGFEVLTRVEHPEPSPIATGATELFRRIGGNESGELGLLARVAPDAGGTS